MTAKNILYFETRNEWRHWLESNFERETEIWFVFPLKDSGMKAVSYNDAVEEALCFGWIDSTAKKHDEKSFIQRFTPRKSKANYSQPNKERLRWLDDNNMIHPKVRMEVEHILAEEFVFPEEILYELKKDPIVWENFNNYSESYKRLRVSYVKDALPREEEYEKRLKNLIDKTKKGKIIIGHGGINKYY